MNTHDLLFVFIYHYGLLDKDEPISQFFLLHVTKLRIHCYRFARLAKLRQPITFHIIIFSCGHKFRALVYTITLGFETALVIYHIKCIEGSIHRMFVLRTWMATLMFTTFWFPTVLNPLRVVILLVRQVFIVLRLCIYRYSIFKVLYLVNLLRAKILALLELIHSLAIILIPLSTSVSITEENIHFFLSLL